jgi:hypothetical protein
VPEITRDAVLTRAPDVIAVRVGEVMVLHDPRGDRYVRLNRTGELVWDCLADGRSVTELADVLSTRYGVPTQVARQDVEHLVADLLARGMLATA